MKVKSESEVAQSCLTLSDPMDCSLPGSSVHGIFQARVLEWGAIAFSLPIISYPQINCLKIYITCRLPWLAIIKHKWVSIYHKCPKEIPAEQRKLEKICILDIS